VNFQKVALNKRDKHLIGLATSCLLALFSAQSCSTVETGTGRCKSFKDPKYVAAVADTDGKKWELRISPEVVDLKCDYKDGETPPSGEVVFTSVIVDGQGYTKPALAVNGRFTGTTPLGKDLSQPGFYQNPYKDDANNADKVDDVATDACGVAIFRLKWVCPAAKKTIGGVFYAESGPLLSKTVKVTLEHPVQPDQIVTTPTTK